MLRIGVDRAYLEVVMGTEAALERYSLSSND
jgi:hypothetical protein